MPLGRPSSAPQQDQNVLRLGIGRDVGARFRCAVSEENLALIESAIQHRAAILDRPAGIHCRLNVIQAARNRFAFCITTSIAAGFQAVAKFVKVGEVDKSELPQITNVAACDRRIAPIT